MYNKKPCAKDTLLKGNPKGVEEVCASMEQYGDECEKVGMLKAILRIMETNNWDAETAMKIIGITESEKPLYAASVEYALSNPIAVAN